MIVALMAQVLVAPASGLPQRVPPTSFTCELMSADGSKVSLAGVTPDFPRGTDPNAQVPMTLAGTGPAGLAGPAMASPGDASDWFREFQVSALGDAGETYRLNLMLRRAGTSIAYTTRFVSGRTEPYDYHAAGTCRADFAPAAAATGTQRP